MRRNKTTNAAILAALALAAALVLAACAPSAAPVSGAPPSQGTTGNPSDTDTPGQEAVDSPAVPTAPPIPVAKSYETSEAHGDFELKQADFTVTYLDAPILAGDSAYFIGGRVYLPLDGAAAAAGGSVSDAGDNLAVEAGGIVTDLPKDGARLGVYPVCAVDGVVCVDLLDFTEAMGLSAVFDSGANELRLYRAAGPAPAVSGAVETGKRAYIRFEDIAANGQSVENAPVYDDNDLAKLRCVADYMAQNGQRFYIAWIPLYMNPPQGIENDLTRDVNLYNAGFLYTLDYMVARGGLIVLHGLTHQSGDDVSGVGVEFGPAAPFSQKEREERMVRVREMAAALGFDNSIFEFPHYAAMEIDYKLAEEYFDVIYQANPDNHSQITTVTTSSGRRVAYIPTPADYVESVYDVTNMLGRLQYSCDHGAVVSLFFHPRMDMDRMSYKIEDGAFTWKYADNAVLPRLLDKVMGLGLTFSAYTP